MRALSEFCCGVTGTGDSDSAVKYCTERPNFLKTAGSISLATGENPVSLQVITTVF